jgi:hypothetical protein
MTSNNEERICRTCLAPIWNEGGTVGRVKHTTGWSDRIERGGDSLVCFKAIHYRHVPLSDREAAIYAQALERGRAVADAEQTELRAEVDRVQSAAKTLGGIVHEQAQMALDATGRHDLIEPDGDGDWQTVWELLAELRPRAEAAERALADERAKVETIRRRMAQWGKRAARAEADYDDESSRDYGNGYADALRDAAKDLRFDLRPALAGPEPDTTKDTQ